MANESEDENKERAARGQLIIAYYASLPGMDPDEALTDLLADLMHARSDFKAALRSAANHFEAEVWLVTGN